MLVNALRFCFMRLVQTELAEFVLDWNVYIILYSVTSDVIDRTQSISYPTFMRDRAMQ